MIRGSVFTEPLFYFPYPLFAVAISLPCPHPSLSSDSVNLYLCDKDCYSFIIKNVGPNCAVLLLQNNELSIFDRSIYLSNHQDDKFLILTSTNKWLDLQGFILYLESTHKLDSRFKLFVDNPLFEILFEGLSFVLGLLNIHLKEGLVESANASLNTLNNQELITNISIPTDTASTKTDTTSTSHVKFQVIYGENIIEKFESYRGAVAKFFNYLFEDIEDPHTFLLVHMQMPEFKKYQTIISNSVHFLHPNGDKETKRRKSEKIKGTESWYWAINRKPWEIQSCLNLLAFHKYKSNYLSINLVKK